MQKSVFYLPLTPETNNTKMNKTDAKEEKWKKQTKQGCPTFMKIENNSWAAAHSASRFMTEMKEAVCTHHCWCLLLLISKEGSLQGIFTFYLYYYNYYYIIYNLSVLVLVLCLFCCFFEFWNFFRQIKNVPFLSGHIPKVLFCRVSQILALTVSGF